MLEVFVTPVVVTGLLIVLSMLWAELDAERRRRGSSRSLAVSAPEVQEEPLEERRAA
ncbi:MAG: hypothetical protein U0360_01025 [Dehalococcoidia bacterium]